MTRLPTIPAWCSISSLLASRLVRFAMAGGASTFAYGIFSFVAMVVFSVAPITSHIVSFVVAVPASYIFQRRFTFRYDGEAWAAFWRFSVTAAVGFLFSTAGVLLANRMGAPSFAGTIWTMGIVPMCSYMMMALWVFVDRR